MILGRLHSSRFLHFSRLILSQELFASEDEDDEQDAQMLQCSGNYWALAVVRIGEVQWGRIPGFHSPLEQQSCVLLVVRAIPNKRQLVD